MNLVVYLSIALLLVLMIPVAEARSSFEKGEAITTTQTVTIDSIALQHSSKKIPLAQLGKCVIFEKDGSQVRNLVMKEIHDHWIVYEKNGSLHDMMIEKIERIEIGMYYRYAIFFSDKGKPYITGY